MIKQAQTVYVSVNVNERLPDYTDDILVSFDNGITYPESAAYRERRQCMLAGVGGGNGYFGKGFCTNGNTGCDNGLILSDVTHWLSEQQAIIISPDEWEKVKADYETKEAEIERLKEIIAIASEQVPKGAFESYKKNKL